MDRFCNALIQIREEIEDIKKGKYPEDDNMLVNAPHSLKEVTANEWTHPYSRELAAYPIDFLRSRGKFWAAVGRLNAVYGDKNLKVLSDDQYPHL